MDFYNVMKVAAAQSKGDGNTKRYSLAVGPPKKDPKVKGVQSAAVRAFLMRKEEEIRQKGLEEKRKKEDLLAKRKEMKHDKKARAMASRTKDNFYGYNGIPIEDKPKKRHADERDGGSNGQTENDEYLTEEEMYEYSQTESEQEEIEEPPPPPPKKQKLNNIKKPLPSGMNFADLLKLAEKKQFEPVELKPVKKNAERPRTAEEIRELEFLERKNQKGDKSLDKHSKPNGQVVKVHKSSSEKHSSSKERHSEDKKLKSSSLSKSGPPEKSRSVHNEAIKKHSDGSHKSEKQASSVSHSKSSKVSSVGNSKQSSGRDHAAKSSSSSSKDVSVNGKHQGSVQVHHAGSSSSGKSIGNSGSSSVRPSSASKHSGTSSSTRPSGSSSSKSPGGSISSSNRPPSISSSSKSHSNSGSVRPSSSSGSLKPTSTSGSVKPHSSSGGSRPSGGGHSSSSSGSARPSASGPSRPASGPPSLVAKPRSVPLGKEPVRPHGGLPLSSRHPANTGPGRPINSSSSGPGTKPKCTVVSETISSKNFVPKSNNAPVNGMRPGNINGMRPGQPNGMRPGQPNGMRPGQPNGMRPGQPNGMRPGLPPGQRPMARPPGPPLPPITSSYKRRIDDEEDEYDSEMEDFIDDGGEPQDVISKHIRDIFGYDRTRYRDESDYALRYMESSFREQQKEEARSLRLGIQEDLEELKREEEELQRKAKLAKKMKKR